MFGKVFATVFFVTIPTVNAFDDSRPQGSDVAGLKDEHGQVGGDLDPIKERDRSDEIAAEAVGHEGTGARVAVVDDEGIERVVAPQRDIPLHVLADAAPLDVEEAATRGRGPEALGGKVALLSEDRQREKSDDDGDNDDGPDHAAPRQQAGSPIQRWLARVFLL